MPELPEVETVVRDLRGRGIRGCKITSAQINWPRSIVGQTPSSLRRAIEGETISAVSRRGKYIVLELSESKQLLVHLRMTGKLLVQPESFKAGKHDHVIFSLSDKSKIVFNDTRKFGKITLVSSGASPLAKLGPEPLGQMFSSAWFRKALAAKKRKIKPLLLDQSFVAGLGNIYVDEALWDARVHPERVSNTISPDEAEALRRAIQTVLKRGIDNCGTTLGGGDTNFYSVAGRRGRNADHLKVFRRTGEPCPACGTAIERLIVGQRGTHICPQCQREGSGSA